MKSKIFNDLKQNLFEGSNPSLLKKNNIIIFLILISLIFFLRAPDVVMQFGRFWAEEGERWFRVAQRSSTFEMLTYAAKNDNINMFFTNFIFSIVKFIPPKFAPLFTTTSAHIATLFCVITILKNNFYFSLNSKYRYLLSILFFFSSSNHPEIWLNTINTMTYFGMIIPFLLFTNYSRLSRRLFIFNYIFLFFVFSTSPYAMFLIPFFAIKYFLTKDFRDFNIMILSLVIFAYQFYLFLAFLDADLVNPKRLSVVKEFNFEIIIYNLFKFIFYTTFGGNILAKFGHLSLYENFIFQILFIMILVSIYINISLASKHSLTFVIIAFYMCFMVMNFSFHGSLVGRYGAAQMFIIYSALLISYQQKKRLLTKFILGLSIIAGIYYTLPHNTTIKNIFLTGPSWFDEYEKWEINKNYEPLYWSGRKKKGTNIYIMENK